MNLEKKQISIGMCLTTLLLSLCAFVALSAGAQTATAPTAGSACGESDFGKGTFFGLKITYCLPLLPSGTDLSKSMPDDQPWPAGAAAAPVFTTTYDIQLGNLTVPAGTYSLYFVPSESGWQLIVNKQSGQPASSYDESENLGTVELITAPALAPPASSPSIPIRSTNGAACTTSCNLQNGADVPPSEYGLPQIHLIFGATDLYVVGQTVAAPATSH